MSRDEERSLLAALAAYDFHEIRMHGQIARRTVRHFGFDYDYDYDYDYGPFRLAAGSGGAADEALLAPYVRVRATAVSNRTLPW